MQTNDGLILTLLTKKNFDFAFLAQKAKKANLFFLMYGLDFRLDTCLRIPGTSPKFFGPIYLLKYLTWSCTALPFVHWLLSPRLVLVRYTIITVHWLSSPSVIWIGYEPCASAVVSTHRNILHSTQHLLPFEAVNHSLSSQSVALYILYSTLSSQSVGQRATRGELSNYRTRFW